MLERPLAYLLWLANSNPPTCGRREFYAVKDRILRRWGRRDPERSHDWQYLERECWTCEGTGRYEDTGRMCRKCGGTGVYEAVWVKLERWRLGRYSFHRPVDRRHSRPEEPCVILKGRIPHADTGLAGAEAGLWLMLAFAPRQWWRQMLGSCHCYPKAWPLLRLQWAIFGVRSRLRLPRRSTCYGCARRHGWLRRRPSYSYCPACVARREAEPADIPF